jgi:cystathionine beta-lyase/cystathionine gamma-synthase
MKNKMIWVETPTNPLMKLADIAAIAKSPQLTILY